MKNQRVQRRANFDITNWDFLLEEYERMDKKRSVSDILNGILTWYRKKGVENHGNTKEDLNQ